MKKIAILATFSIGLALPSGASLGEMFRSQRRGESRERPTP
jgi:hypothetical protein